MRGLLTPHRRPVRERDGTWSLSGWVVDTEGDAVTVRRTGDDADDGLRAVAVAAWLSQDERPDRALDTCSLDDLWPSG
jgi:hypothetical protein